MLANTAEMTDSETFHQDDVLVFVFFNRSLLMSENCPSPSPHILLVGTLSPASLQEEHTPKDCAFAHSCFPHPFFC